MTVWQGLMNKCHNKRGIAGNPDCHWTVIFKWFKRNPSFAGRQVPPRRAADVGVRANISKRKLFVNALFYGRSARADE
jgi:hypothetical protein